MLGCEIYLKISRNYGPNSYSEKKDSQYIRRENHYNKLLVHLEKVESNSKELDSTFSCINGKIRYKIKNDRRLSRIPEDDIIIHDIRGS